MTANGILIAALLAMSTGRVPMYVTAVIGGVAALLAAGVPFSRQAFRSWATRRVGCPRC